MGKLFVGRGAAMVELDDELDRAVRQAADALAPGLVHRMEQAIEEIGLNGQRDWPVKTGVSKAAFRWGVRLPDLDHIQGFVINPAERGGKPYAYLVKGKQQGGKPSWRVLVEDPARATIERLVEDLAETAASIINKAG